LSPGRGQEKEGGTRVGAKPTDPENHPNTLLREGGEGKQGTPGDLRGVKGENFAINRGNKPVPDKEMRPYSKKGKRKLKPHRRRNPQRRVFLRKQERGKSGHELARIGAWSEERTVQGPKKGMEKKARRKKDEAEVVGRDTGQTGRGTNSKENKHGSKAEKEGVSRVTSRIGDQNGSVVREL